MNRTLDIVPWDLAYDAGARTLVAAFQRVVNAPTTSVDDWWTDSAPADEAFMAFLDVSPADAVMPRLLRDPTIWGSIRNDVITQLRAARRNPGSAEAVRYTQVRPHLTFGLFVQHLHALALEERAPFIGEWHVARVCAEHGADLHTLGLDVGRLVARMAEATGIVQASDTERKTCFACNTNFVIQSTLRAGQLVHGASMDERPQGLQSGVG